MSETVRLSNFASIANAVFNSVSANATAVTAMSVGGHTINATGFPGTANNANNLGGIAAASYQLNSALAANVATMAANSATFANSSATNTFTVGTAAYFVANGNVGIGTSNPGSARLNVAGFTFISGDFTIERANPRIRFNNTAGTFTTLLTAVDSGSAGIITETNSPLYFSTNNIERARITTAGDFQFNSGYGSVATAFGSRAWVNFNGTGTVAIRGSGNVSSITDNGNGDYTVNFTNAMPDANYSAVVSGGMSGAGAAYGSVSNSIGGTFVTTGSARINTRNTGGSLTDADTVMVAVFR